MDLFAGQRQAASQLLGIVADATRLGWIFGSDDVAMC
jgi:hypothetical protein